MSKYQYTPGPRMGEPESPTKQSLLSMKLLIIPDMIPSGRKVPSAFL
jgi:hypothetical protein